MEGVYVDLKGFFKLGKTHRVIMEGHALNEHKEVLFNWIIPKFLLAVCAQLPHC